MTGKIEEQTCKRCGKSWFPHKPGVPVKCAKCNSPYWRTERKNPKPIESSPEITIRAGEVD